MPYTPAPGSGGGGGSGVDQVARDAASAAQNLAASKVSGAGVSAIQRLTQAEYDALTTPDEGTMYLISG